MKYLSNFGNFEYLFSFEELEEAGFDSDIDGIAYHHTEFGNMLFTTSVSFPYYQKTGGTKYSVTNYNTGEEVEVETVAKLKEAIRAEELIFEQGEFPILD